MASEFLDRLSSEINATATEIKERTGHSNCDGWSFTSEDRGYTLRCGCGLGLLAELQALTFGDADE